jgi:predicted glycosyltransferase
VNIQIPFYPLQWLVNLINRRILKQFDECWIPDLSTSRLSGKLSDPKKLPHIRFIGLLSRMEKLSIPEKWDLVVVLSGPEPQRTIFEKMIITQVKQLNINTIIIQGLTEKRVQKSISEHIKIISYATSKELNEVMCAAKVILCRSGYSSLMDLAVIQKKAILVPTPGQTEQEYLADFLFEKGIFYSQRQKSFDLKKALEELEAFSGFKHVFKKNSFLFL